MEHSESEPDKELIARSRDLLARTFGGPVELGEAEVLREQYRNYVLRCAVQEAPPGAPASVVIKASVGEEESAYDPDNDTSDSTAWRFYNEWAGNQFLDACGGDPPHNARLLCGDRAHGFFILEDLGNGECLADIVRGDDPQKAATAFLNYATALGRMHAATVGQEAAWRRTRLQIGGKEETRQSEGGKWLPESVESFRTQCAELDVPIASGFDEEIAAIRQTLENPGPFYVFSPNDTCPDNHRIMPDGSLRFFDFEWAGYRHALLDAAYFHLPFPTCWCVNRLPEGMPERMEQVYRTALSAGCPEAQEDALFTTAMSHICGFWTLGTLGMNLAQAREEDSKWGLSTVRQRHLLRLETFTKTVGRFGHLPAMSASATALAAKLRELWPEVQDMPVYPAFRTDNA